MGLVGHLVRSAFGSKRAIDRHWFGDNGMGEGNAQGSLGCEGIPRALLLHSLLVPGMHT